MLQILHFVGDSHVLSLCNRAQKARHGILNGLMCAMKASIDCFIECGAVSSSIHISQEDRKSRPVRQTLMLAYLKY